MIRSDSAWNHMVQLYALPGVMPQCMTLQEQAGISVTTLLTLIISAAHGDGAPDGATAAGIAESSEAFQARVLRPLRQSRNGLRDWFHGPAADQARNLRNALLDRELAAERLEQSLALELLAAPEARRPAEDPLADASRGVARYLTALGVWPDAALRQSLAHILSAALEDYDGLHLSGVMEAALQETRNQDRPTPTLARPH